MNERQLFVELLRGSKPSASVGEGRVDKAEHVNATWWQIIKKHASDGCTSGRRSFSWPARAPRACSEV